VNIRGESDTPTIADERIPTKEELAKILCTATPRGRVAIALLALSGLRPQSLGNYQGTDGLRLKDLPETTVTATGLTFDQVPSRVVVRKPLSKNRRRYFTFLPDEATIYLREHLEERVRHGEPLNPDTPLLGFDPRGPRKNPCLRTTLVTRDVKVAITKAGYDWRPYVLRAYFDTTMIIAESKGLIAHPYIAFFMGHQGDMEARYSTNKGRLPQQMIEDMRASYRKCQPYLETLTQPINQSSIVKEAKKEALKSLAKSLLDIDLLDVKIAKERELDRALDVDEEIALFETTIQKLREQDDDPQLIVAEADLEAYLHDGWEFISVLPSQKILIRK
jgi:hypothetical protein